MLSKELLGTSKDRKKESKRHRKSVVSGNMKLIKTKYLLNKDLTPFLTSLKGKISIKMTKTLFKNSKFLSTSLFSKV